MGCDHGGDVVWLILGGHQVNYIATDNVEAAHGTEMLARLVDRPTGHTSFDIGYARCNGGGTSIEVEGDVHRHVTQPRSDRVAATGYPLLAILLHGDHLVAEIVRRFEPVARARVAAHTDLNAVSWINVPLAHQIGCPVGSRFHRSHPM